VKVKVRALLVLPAVLIAGIGLSACSDTKVGTSAVVNGDKISDSEVSGYLTRNVAPIQNSDGTTTNPRQLVLSSLIQDKIFADLFAANGGVPSQSDLNKLESDALQGQTRQATLSSITSAGLEPKFLDLRLHTVEMQVLLTQKYSSTQLNSLLAKARQNVSVSAQYGSWDPTNLTLNPISAKQLPSGVTLDTPLPGDSSAAASAAPSPSQ
jgi:hypothetical protein